jgi:hypothetical protein
VRADRRTLEAGIILIGGLLTVPPSAYSQGLGSRNSLGGYGATMFDSGMGTASPVIPYAGRFGGFMPSRMGGGDLSFRPRGSEAMSPVRISAGTTSAFRGMSSMSGGMSPGLGTGMRPSMSGSGRMGVMPPSFGYPFRQPPSPLPPTAPGTGMPM